MLKYSVLRSCPAASKSDCCQLFTSNAELCQTGETSALQSRGSSGSDSRVKASSKFPAQLPSSSVPAITEPIWLSSYAEPRSIENMRWNSPRSLPTTDSEDPMGIIDDSSCASLSSSIEGARDSTRARSSEMSSVLAPLRRSPGEASVLSVREGACESRTASPPQSQQLSSMLSPESHGRPGVLISPATGDTPHSSANDRACRPLPWQPLHSPPRLPCTSAASRGNGTTTAPTPSGSSSSGDAAALSGRDAGSGDPPRPPDHTAASASSDGVKSESDRRRRQHHPVAPASANRESLASAGAGPSDAEDQERYRGLESALRARCAARRPERPLDSSPGQRDAVPSLRPESPHVSEGLRTTGVTAMIVDGSLSALTGEEDSQAEPFRRRPREAEAGSRRACWASPGLAAAVRLHTPLVAAPV
mmetsp:Transcript_8546/g.18734  ORF Transcript_8546/g.18734 Transcript_8546/m.18734 type:complete len:420 (-) Transcript_8546:143-1402(-)